MGRWMLGTAALLCIAARLHAVEVTPGSTGAAPEPELAIPRAPVVNTVPSCHDLWYARNLIYDRAGYCFQTAKAQSYFSNVGCTGGLPSAAEMREVERLKALEQQFGC